MYIFSTILAHRQQTLADSIKVLAVPTARKSMYCDMVLNQGVGLTHEWWWLSVLCNNTVSLYGYTAEVTDKQMSMEH